MPRPTISQARLKEVLDYNPQTDTWVWIRHRPGKIAGGVRNGRRYIIVDGHEFSENTLKKVWNAPETVSNKCREGLHSECQGVPLHPPCTCSCHALPTGNPQPNIGVGSGPHGPYTITSTKSETGD